MCWINVWKTRVSDTNLLQQTGNWDFPRCCCSEGATSPVLIHKSRLTLHTLGLPLSTEETGHQAGPPWRDVSRRLEEKEMGVPNRGFYLLTRMSCYVLCQAATGDWHRLCLPRHLHLSSSSSPGTSLSSHNLSRDGVPELKLNLS